jgi:hypothetical protein
MVRLAENLSVVVPDNPSGLHRSLHLEIELLLHCGVTFRTPGYSDYEATICRCVTLRKSKN